MDFKTFTLSFALFLNVVCCADTFRHKSDGTVYTGYVKQTPNGDLHTVVTKEHGVLGLNLSEYDIELNSLGRNPHIALLTIDEAISYEYQVGAFEKAIVEEADKGPLLIIIELDTPGGRVDLAKRICSSVIALQYCRTVAYVSGGQNGGAFSAGAAIAMSCDQLFMAPGTTIGAAAMIAATDEGIMDMKSAYGDTVGEKFNASWRNYLASLAEENDRPGALAKAMADEGVVVVEVKRDGHSAFIEKSHLSSNDRFVRTVCQSGELLAMPANEAVLYHFADALADSKDELLMKLNHPKAEIKINREWAESSEEFEKVIRRFNKLNEALDLKFREIMAKSKRGSLTRSQAIRDFQKLIKNAEYLLNLKRSYPDLPVSEESIFSMLNSIKAEYKSIKAMR